MRLLIGNRASSVLYNWLTANNIYGKVLLAANICESVPSTYLKAGLGLVFCDIDKSTFTPNYDAVIKMLQSGKDITVLHYNHTYGMISDEEIGFLRKTKELFPKLIIIEDRCLSVPDLIEPDTSADLILYSTGHTKVVNIQYGGFGFTRSEYNYAEKKEDYEQSCEDMFSKHVKECHLLGIEANMSIFQNKWIDTEVRFDKDAYLDTVKGKMVRSLEHKKHLNSIYEEKLGFSSLDNNYQNWRYNILVDNQEECLKVIFENGLYASKHYKSLGSGYFVVDEFNNCDWLEKHIINLFNDFYYTEAQAFKTAELLEKIAQKVSDKA